MLDIDTLNALHDLMARTLYNAEVARLPVLTRAEEVELVMRARRGDKEARASLIIGCLARVWLLARRFYRTHQPTRDEALDFAQAANLAMLLALDRALTKANPVAYLQGIAKRAMAIRSLYYSDLIRKPEYTLAQLAKIQVPTVESLDALVGNESTTRKIDLIEMAPPPDEDQEAAMEKRFQPLYDALARLTPRQRHNIAKQYGVGQIDPAIANWQGIRPHVLAALRKVLEPHLKQMLSPEQEE